MQQLRPNAAPKNNHLTATTKEMIRRQRSEEETCTRAFIVVFWQGKINRLKLACMNSFRALWNIGTLPNCLASGLWTIEQIDSGCKCENPVREVVEG